MTGLINLADAHKIAIDSYHNGSRDDAERMASGILSHFHNDFIANKLIGLIGRDVGNYPPALTFLRNALRHEEHDEELLQAISECVSGMQDAVSGRDIYVIGDSHTEPFRRLERTVVRWVGPVTMYRISKESTEFLDYRFYGVKEGCSVICVFGEIDGRAHMLKDNTNLVEDINELTSGYLRALKNACDLAKPARQIVSSLMPPSRNLPAGFPVFGSIEERINVVNLMNERIRFGCMVLGFDYLDQYTLFSDRDGALDERYSPDGLHIDRKYTEIIAQPLGKIFSRSPK